MLPHNPRQRESLAIIGLLTLALILVVVLFHVNAANGSEPRPVARYECGKAIGVHDAKPGYHIVQRAHYVEYEDGSGVLYCGRNVIARVGVPW